MREEEEEPPQKQPQANPHKRLMASNYTLTLFGSPFYCQSE